MVNMSLNSLSLSAFFFALVPILCSVSFRYNKAVPFHRPIFPTYLANSLLWPYAGVLCCTELGLDPFWGAMQIPKRKHESIAKG